MMRRFLCIGTVALASLAPFSGGQASACMVDGKPSAYANGVRAVISRQIPTAKTFAWWARFAFPHALHAGRSVTFSEDDAMVLKALQGRPLDVGRRWRWDFGDGHTEIGDRVTHAYRRPGHYRVSVDAYFQGYGWQTFDSITATVQR